MLFDDGIRQILGLLNWFTKTCRSLGSYAILTAYLRNALFETMFPIILRYESGSARNKSVLAIGNAFCFRKTAIIVLDDSTLYTSNDVTNNNTRLVPHVEFVNGQTRTAKTFCDKKVYIKVTTSFYRPIWSATSSLY